MKKFLCVLAAVMAVFVWSAGTFPDGRVRIPYLADHLYLTGYPVDTLLGYA